jgi:hypothetical protein
VTVTSLPISIGVISTVIVTALGSTLRVEPAIGDVATNELASAGAAKRTVNPSAVKTAAKRFTW